jgi:DNA-binding NarL/FixJ family response regulator
MCRASNSPAGSLPNMMGLLGSGGHFMVESGLDCVGVFQRLKPRQKRCAALLVSGYSTNVAIARRLGTTLSAVANNISLIMDACGVFSRLNLVLFIVRTPGLEQKLLEFEERVQREKPVAVQNLPYSSHVAPFAPEWQI